MDKTTYDKNTKTLLTVFAIVIFMIVLAFASVPLYRLFCQATGFAGTTQLSQSLPDKILDRKITIQFNTDVNRKLPWKFRSETSKIELNIGQDALINFTAQNNGDVPIAGTAIYNVTPLKAGKYFHKTQCFCFDYQILDPKEKVNMPVIFYIDPSIVENPDMDDITTITLSYSFFKSDSSELDDAMSIFYNEDNN